MNEPTPELAFPLGGEYETRRTRPCSGAGMVVTVEPAVATADGIFHHEHDVLVTEDGPEVISEARVELFEVR